MAKLGDVRAQAVFSEPETRLMHEAIMRELARIYRDPRAIPHKYQRWVIYGTDDWPSILRELRSNR